MTSKRTDPLQTIQNLIKEQYKGAKAVFWSGSVSQNQGTDSSDLDLVIVFESLPHAYREAFVYDGWPIDAFIHDLDTLRYFCGKLEANDGRPALINMILNSHEILAPNELSNQAKVIANEALIQGPDRWSNDQIDKERFLITDILDDIKFPASREEQIASAAHLYEPLIQLYFRAQKKWCASGKSMIRYLKNDNPELALDFTNVFENLFKTGDTTSLEALVKRILAPYGGLFWDGFKLDASKEAKISEPITLNKFNDGYQVYLDESKNEYVDGIILKGLKAYNETKIVPYSRENFLLFVKNKSGQLIAGLSGDILGDLCGIHLLWVDEAHRQKGIGGKIIKELEKYALSKKCKIIQLDTTEFQANDFYRKHGYLATATLDKGFMGYTQYIMRKILSESNSGECTSKILNELKSREPIFHHPENFGKTKQDIENQMCDEFWEVGASGNVYTKQDVLDALLARYNDLNYQDIWEAKDFELTKITADNYLLTYVLIQDKTRVTRRSTLWRRVNGCWKILYHQGTVIDGGGA